MSLFDVNDTVSTMSGGRRYVGTVRKVVKDDSGTSYYVQFSPGGDYVSFRQAALSRVWLRDTPPPTEEDFL